jgi:hypothetical protein
VNGKERYLAAVRHEVPNRLPMDSPSIACLPALAEHLGVPENQVRAEVGLGGVEVEAEYVGPVRAALDGTPPFLLGHAAESVRRAARVSAPGGRHAGGELGKRQGLFVMMHSCGDITEILPDLFDIGVDIWQTVQLHALPMTPEELKRRFGRNLMFFGGIHTQRLPFQSPATVRAEVRRCVLALGRGGGYAVSPDHAIKEDVPFESVLAPYESVRAFRADGYTREGSQASPCSPAGVVI